jgi:endonuclease YncB( thermonuclease family)
MARAALRRFVRGRAVECEVPAGAGSIPDPARCHVAGRDVAEWLVEQGWAKGEGASYAEAQSKARQAGRGLWSERRPGAQPDFAAAGERTSAPASAAPMSERVSGMP